MPKNYIPPEYIEALNNDDSITDKQAVLNSVLAINQSYPYDTYYPYSKDASMGSYKWFIKQFIDMARKHDASPVLVTAPARTFSMLTEQLWTLPAATVAIISAILELCARLVKKPAHLYLICFLIQLNFLKNRT